MGVAEFPGGTRLQALSFDLSAPRLCVLGGGVGNGQRYRGQASDDL